jgi:hypothetical protein
MSLEDGEYLQLHEFFDLLLWCEPYDPSIAGDVHQLTESGKDQQGYFSMVDFDDLLRHVDQRIYAVLDDRYRSEELIFLRQKRASRFLSKDIPPVSRTAREDQVRRAKSQHSALRNALKRSQDRVRQSRIGYFLDKPFDFVELQANQLASGRLSQQNFHSKTPDSVTTLDQPVTASSNVNPVLSFAANLSLVSPNVLDLVRPWVRPHSTLAVGARKVASRPCISSLSHHDLQLPIVSKQDRIATASSLNSARFDSETAESKYERTLQRKMVTFNRKKSHVVS